MRLISLNANHASFHTVNFNREGISVIVGRKESTLANNRRSTYNGVGKSLVIALVHFCLGANAKKGLTKALPDWNFSLEFEIGEKIFNSTRNTHDPSKIDLNGKVYKLDAFRDYIEGLLFDIPNNINFLKFRPLISRFIRPNIESYKSYDSPVPKEQDYGKQLCNAFLLGLDPVLAETKHRLRNDLSEVKKFAKNLSKDEVLKQFFTEGENVDFEIVRLNKKVTDLKSRIAKFVIADDFDSLKKEADKLSSELRELRNRRVVIENAIKSIEKSLLIKPDLTSEELVGFYHSAKVQLNTLVIKEIKEIEKFNEKLIIDRQKRLEKERRDFLLELEPLKTKIYALGNLEDEKLQQLASTGALDDYQALTTELSTNKLRLNKLESFKKLMEEYKIKQLNIEKQLNDENIETINYLNRVKKNVIEKNILTFQELSQQFYENKRAGIEIENNEGENQIRYHIKAEIEHDASDGINQVKLFCFDFTLLKNRFNHKVDCLFHDSRLLDPMDPRQRVTVFNMAHEETLNTGFQYIISVNEDALNSIKEYMDEKDFQEIIQKNIILQLTDESPETKLLGMSVDMNYEKG